MILHIDQRQQMITFDQLGILVQNFAKLNGSHILMAFPAHGEGIVIFLDAFVDCFQFVLVCLKPGNIF